MTLPDCMMGPSEPCAGFSFEQARLEAEIDRLRAALDTHNLADQYKADYERSVLNGDRLFDEVERLRADLAAARELIDKLLKEAEQCYTSWSDYEDEGRAFLERTKTGWP